MLDRQQLRVWLVQGLSTHPRFGWAIAAIGGICWGSGAVPLAGCRGRVPGKEVWAESFMLYKYS